MNGNLKDKTVNAVAWNSIERVISLLINAFVGIILANILLPEDFGAVGIIIALSSFMNIFTESGFNTALIQKKNTSERDYNTVFTFNLFVSLSLYFILFFCAPLISQFYNEPRITALSRVIFLGVIFQAFGLVQSSMLIREMRMKEFNLANIVSNISTGIVSIVLVLAGFGVWALVFQQLTPTIVRTSVYYIKTRWKPRIGFNKTAFKEMFSVGSNIFLTSFVSTLFQNIYSLVIGKVYNMNQLGYYNQADKWSKMGYTSISQVMAQPALPVLSSIQNDRERMQRVFSKLNKTTAYIVFAVFGGLIVMAEPIFHLFFGTKWDLSIPLFQLLLAKGIFFVFVILMNNYITSTGRTRAIFFLELIKDTAIVIAIVFTIGIDLKAIVIGQLIATVVHFIVTLFYTQRITGYSVTQQLKDHSPYLLISSVISALLIFIGQFISNEILLLAIQLIVFVTLYLSINKLLNSKIQKDIIDTIKQRFQRN